MIEDSPRTAAPADDAPATTAPIDVAPSKPAAPQAPSRPSPAPEPVDLEVDDAVIVNPVAAPEPGEVDPEPRGPFDALPAEAASPAPTLTSLEALGHAAAVNASLSASGAPTPLGGIPTVPNHAAAALSFDDGHPPFVPTFAGAAARGADDPAPGQPEEPAEEPAATGGPASLDQHDLAHDVPLYRPRVSAAPGTTPAGAPGEPTPPSSAPSEESPRHPGRAWPLVLIGLATMSAITLALMWPALHPASIEIPAQHVLSEPAGTAVDPIQLTDPTPFLAAMPTVAETWALTNAETHQATTDELLPGRVVEWHTLTYSDGTDEVTLEARQLYTEADAHAALLASAGKDATLDDAVVAAVVVGERAEETADNRTTIMWTHGSAYFEATGPTEAVLGLVEVLGL